MAAAQDLPSGKVLSTADVAQVHLPQELLPEGSFRDSAALAGKQLAAPMRKGQLFADSHLVGPGLLTGAPHGAAAVPLRLSDPSSIQLLSPGQLINVVLTGGNGYEQQAPSEVLAESVPVLWTSAQGGKTGQWLESEDADGLIVVAANPDQAGRLAGASTKGKLFFVLVG
jgi:Flp pilus assembly protein CpaB